MRKLIFLLFMVIIGFGALQAKPIDRNQAAQHAREFLSRNLKKSRAVRKAPRTVTLTPVETGQPLVYAFNVEGGGYVIAAGDDCAPAILGFSETATFDPSDMPDGMKDLFAQYQQEMQAMGSKGQRAAVIENLGSPISPLMKSKWGQSAPYNYMAPKYLRRNKQGQVVLSLSYTGCPATAMSQILYYYKYPAAITEIPGEYYNVKKEKTVMPIDVSRELEWDKMLPSYGTRVNVEGTQDQQNAVAKLMRLVGQSVCTSYSPEGSGSYSSSILTSFVNYFNYDASTIKLIDKVNYSYLDWIKTIHQELVNKRPVFFAGSSPDSGHAFVVDGYYDEDYFYINWGWNGSQDDHVYHLLLCNPSEKYEGGGRGDAGYSGAQEAIIGIQPASTPQHIDPVFEGDHLWYGKFSYTRSDINQNFALEKCLFTRTHNRTHFDGNYDYGIIVYDANGQSVQSLLPISPEFENIKAEPGKSKSFRPTINIGASLGDGIYTMQFVYRIGKGEWRPTAPIRKFMFKIKGNELIFDCRPDWLTVQKTVEKVEGTQKPQFKVTVTLENKSADKIYHRTVRLKIDNYWKETQPYGATVYLEPGETKTITMDYIASKYVPNTFYVATQEDCVALSEGIASGTDYQTEGASFSGNFNVTDALQKQADQTYVLRADGGYEVTYTLTNIGKDNYKGYLELVDSVASDLHQFEENDYEGDVITLKPGESKDLKLTIYNDNKLHKVSLVQYTEDDQPNAITETPPFVIRPVYNLSMSDVSVTPTEPLDDELAGLIVKGNQLTVKGKINNPEPTAFEGTIVLRRYVNDLNREYVLDEDDCYSIESDKTLTREVTIPAGGSIDYTETLDLQGLPQGAYYSVLVDFDINFVRKSSTDEVLLYDSEPYMVFDGSTTGIVDIISKTDIQSSAVYDLNGRRVSGRLPKGIYIKGGKKMVVK